MDIQRTTFLEVIADTVEVLLVSFFKLIWWIISSVARGIWSFIKAVLGNVYGRIVVGLGGLIFLYLTGVFIHLIK